MIEINLVPDIKQQYLRSQRLRAKVISFSVITSLAAGAVVVALAMYMGTQVLRNTLADKEITAQNNTLNEKFPDLSKVVTIQNQLTIISSLNNEKLVSSRLFDLLGGINPKAPNNVKMSTVSVDPVKSTVTIESTADEGFNAADTFKKTITNTMVAYTKGGSELRVPLAKDVTVSNTSFGEDATGKKVLRFRLSFAYPKELMSNESTNVRVESPTGIIDVTDSNTGVPESLFAQPAADIQEDK